MCPTKPSATTVLTINENIPTKPDAQVLHINEEESIEPLTKAVIVNNAAVDTGSGKTLIRKSIAEQVGSAVPCPMFILQGFGGSRVRCNEKLDVALKMDEKLFKGTVYIIDDNVLSHAVLLGMDFLGSN